MGGTVTATPSQHLRMLLARAQNPFDVADHTIGLLSSAVVCHVELEGWHHRNAPPPTARCSSYRHSFLLADGNTLSLWELRHETGDGPGAGCDSGSGAGTSAGSGSDSDESAPWYELYEHEEPLRLARQRAHPRLDGTDHARGATRSGEPHPADGLPEVPRQRGPEHARGAEPAANPEHAQTPARAPEPERTPECDSGRGFIDFLAAAGETARTRAYEQDDSPDHARRLVRRAENPDRPGEETLRLLSTARGHEIVHVPKPHSCAPPFQIWCSVYEHAFLLADGTEVSLYELEHNLTGTGRLVCEVYLEETVADQAARRRARDRGIEL